jgi:hypothetical protein
MQGSFLELKVINSKLQVAQPATRHLHAGTRARLCFAIWPHGASGNRIGSISPAHDLLLPSAGFNKSLR